MVRRAAFDAAATLTLVTPAIVLPRLLEQIEKDLDLEKVKSLNDSDLAIWNTVEGTLYVDGNTTFFLCGFFEMTK